MALGPERRKHPRKAVDLTAEIELADGRRLAARLDQMSIGGSFVQSGEVQPFGTALTLHFTLPISARAYALTAVVRWTSPAGMGVQFGPLGGRETYELSEFLAKIP